MSLSRATELTDGYTTESLRRMATATPDLRLPSPSESTATIYPLVAIHFPISLMAGAELACVAGCDLGKRYPKSKSAIYGHSVVYRDTYL